MNLPSSWPVKMCIRDRMGPQGIDEPESGELVEHGIPVGMGFAVGVNEVAETRFGGQEDVYKRQVEDNCLIGMGSIILDGEVIGQGSVVGAGALITKIGREHV